MQGIEGEELPFYKVNALASARADGSLQLSVDTVSREIAADLKAFIFPPQTIVFAKIGAALLLGRIRQLSEEACLDNNMMGLIIPPVNSPSFFRYALTLVRFDLIANLGTVPSLNESQVANVQLAIPPRDEQERIVTFLEEETNRLAQLSDEAQNAVKLLRERRSALISAAVTGKIDVRDLAEHRDAAE